MRQELTKEQHREFVSDLGEAIARVIAKYYPDEFPHDEVAHAIQCSYAVFLSVWASDDSMVRKWMDHCNEFGRRHFTT